MNYNVRTLSPCFTSSRMRGTASGSKIPDSIVAMRGTAIKYSVPAQYSTARRKRCSDAWRPVTEPLRHLMDTQEHVRVKSADRSNTKRQEALNLLAISRREVERKQSITLCREQAGRRESAALIELLDLPCNVKSIKRQNSTNRRASSASEMIASSFAAKSRPFMRTSSQVFSAPPIQDDLPKRITPKIPAFKSIKVLNPRPGFANLPIKQNSKSLAHACGFQSLTLFF
jgi:hypothetical protein